MGIPAEIGNGISLLNSTISPSSDLVKSIVLINI